MDQQNKQDTGQEKDDDILHYKGCISLIMDLLALIIQKMTFTQPIVYADMYSLANFLLTADTTFVIEDCMKKKVPKMFSWVLKHER